MTALATPFTVSATEIVNISTGEKGLSYDSVFGANMVQVLSEYGYKATTVRSKGSMQNNDRVASGEALLGFTQADAHALWLKQHPNEATNIEILGVIGSECLFVAVSETGTLKDEDGIGEGTKVAIGSPDSGSNASWTYATTLESDYSKATVFNRGGIRSLASLTTGKYDAFVFVTSGTNKQNKYFNAINSENSGLTLIDFDDYDLNDKLPNGNAVYKFEDIVYSTGFFDKSVEVPCTDILVIANVDANPDLLDDVAGVILTNKQRITSVSN